MFEDIYNALTSWFYDAVCWLFSVLIDIAASLMEMVSSYLPSVSVPDWVYSTPFDDSMTDLIGWVIPFENLYWALGIVLAFEVGNAVILPLYRLINDLL